MRFLLHPKIKSWLKTLSNWQPFTWRGLLAILLSTIALRLFAIPEYDLVADLLSKSILFLALLTLAISFFLRLHLGRKVSVEIRFDPLSAVSKKKVPAGIVVYGCNIPPYFYIGLYRQFLHSGVISPLHLLKGNAPDRRRRILIDEIEFPHRGYWALQSVEFSVGDVLGLTKFSWSLPIDSGIEVSAKTLPIINLPIVASSSRSGDELHQSRELAGDLFDIKPYDPSDGIKRILWKTYARSGQLVSRRPEPAVIPEGEVAIYLIAHRLDDHVAGALQGYVKQLVENQITILFGTDGMENSSNSIPSEQKFVSNYEEILHSINHNVWSASVGSGEGFSSFMSALHASGRFIHNVIVFAPKENEGGSKQMNWLKSLQNLAAARSIKLTIALVPKNIDPENFLSLLASQQESPVLRQIKRIKNKSHSLDNLSSEKELFKAIQNSGSELLIVENPDRFGTYRP